MGVAAKLTILQDFIHEALTQRSVFAIDPNALAQEKTGEFWVCDEMFGGWLHPDVEHSDLAIFIGKNPWHSHGIP